MKLLITGAWQCSEAQLQSLRDMGHEVYFLQNEKEPLPVEARQVEGVVCNGLFLHHPIERFENLKYIQLTSAGFDRVDLDYIQAHNVMIHNARGVYSIPMAEHAVLGVLMLYKQMNFFLDNQRQHRWEKHRGLLELGGKTVCVLGAGNVGQECAKRFAAFGCRVLGIDIFPGQRPYIERVYPLEDMEKVLPESDIVVLTLPLTEQTRYMFGERMFDCMKQGSVLVNIARGQLVQTNVLLAALQNKLLGAVLDVFEQEPLAEDSPLWDMENVILTPHNSFVGEGNRQRLTQVVLANIQQSCCASSEGNCR